jgi:hypothetical protein
MTTFVQAFNTHFFEFIEDIKNVFPEDVDILTASNILIAMRKTNPKLIVKIWKTYIVDKYKNEIEQGDIDFFINKDYTNDVSASESSTKIMNAINRLRTPIKNMSEENQLKSIKYIQNLTKLSAFCDDN